MGYKIAIDGPSGVGKGYLATRLAEKIGFLNIDTGSMYRAFGLFVKNNNVDLKDEKKVKEALDNVNIDFKHEEGKFKVRLNGKFIEDSIRTEEIAYYAFLVSSLPIVRTHMVKLQREIAGNNNVVMEGRDIGSVVLKDADIKIFLTASLAVRAKRRYDELILKNKDVTLDKVLENIKLRDELDSKKLISPLIQTEDMIEIDTTNLNKDEVLEKVLDIVIKKGWKISD